MTSKNNPNHNKYLGPTPEQMAMQAELQQRARGERVDAILTNCAAQIYAQLVGYAWTASEGEIGEDEYRAMARVAKDAAPYFGEALGFLRVAPKAPPEPTPPEQSNGIPADEPSREPSPIILP